MSQTAICYASPKIIRELEKAFGKAVSTVKVKMRDTKDVPIFIRKVEYAHRKAGKSRLQFD